MHSYLVLFIPRGVDEIVRKKKKGPNNFLTIHEIPIDLFF